MPEPFKEWFNAALVRRLGSALSVEVPDFDAPGFEAAVLDAAWPSRELKQRMSHLAFMLGRFLPGSYDEQVQALYVVAPGFRGFTAVVFSDFVAQYGLDHFDRSVEALRFFTPLASSEFAVRPFILRYGPRMMDVMESWADDGDEHVRRLATEGCRPRLPWGMGLPAFRRNPEPVLRILEKLRNDASEYVRRSVANNLNDIAKDHPEQVVELARRWMDQPGPDTRPLVVYALRSLLKTGHAGALAVSGIEKEAPVEIERFTVSPARVPVGGTTTLELVFRNPLAQAQAFRLEYAITFINRSGRGGRKVFQWKKAELEGGRSVAFQKNHSFRDVSIRRHYPGPHTVSCVLNGGVVAEAVVEVVEP